MEEREDEFSITRANDALNELFFDGRFAGRPVFLSLDNRLRSELADALGTDVDTVENDICDVVGLSLSMIGDPYKECLRANKRWQAEGMKVPPPFTAVLFCLAHAAESMAADGDYGRNNYYARLSQATTLDQQTLSLKGKSTDPLWNGLNLWLIANDHLLGKPTAYAINSWKYVGRALSQAVVRASDRKIFHDMFERFGLSGSEQFTPDEMGHYISNWIYSSVPNARLKAAWSKRELQTRVCEAAIAELADWTGLILETGETSDRNAKRSSRLTLVSNIVPGFPKISLELYLGRLGELDDQDPYRTRNSDQNFNLSNSVFGSFATLSPSKALDPSEILNRGIHVCRQNQELEWRSKTVVLFVKSSQGPYWVEVNHASFGVPHLLLVRDIQQLPEKVEAYLTGGAALTPPRKAVSKDIAGLPAGWVLYQDIRLKYSEDKPDPELQCLIPLAEDGFLSIEKGLQLLQDFYHSSAEIGVEFVAAQAPTQVEAVPILEAEFGERIWKSDGNSCNAVIEAPHVKTLAGNGLALIGRISKGIVARREIYLRDANRPSPIDRRSRGALVYRSIVGASPRDDDKTLGVTGNIVEFDIEPLPTSTASTAAKEPPPANVAGNDEQSEAVDAQTIGTGSGISCVERGHHYWICQTRTLDMSQKAPLSQTCKDCRRTLVLANRGKPMRDVKLANPVQFLPVTAKGVSAQLDHDAQFDALCFIGCGSWGKFDQLFGAGLLTALELRSIADQLSLLGFLDIEVKTGSNQLRAWSVPAPAANFTADKAAFLSGFRSSSLLDQIRDWTEIAGGLVRKVIRSGQPTAIWIEGLDPTQLNEALEDVRDPFGRSITILQQPSLSLTSACISMGDLSRALGSVSIGRPKNLQRFDPYLAKWEDAQSTIPNEAYRWNEGRQVYAFVNENGDARCGPHQIVKVLAAKAKGMRLHGVDTQGNFLATLGCEPPGLLGRALVAATGKLPTMGGGRIKYERITKEVSSSIISILYSEVI